MFTGTLWKKRRNRLLELPFLPPPQTDQISLQVGLVFLFRTTRRKKSKKPRSMFCIVDSVWIVIGTLNTKKLTIMCLIITDKLENKLE